MGPAVAYSKIESFIPHTAEKSPIFHEFQNTVKITPSKVPSIKLFLKPVNSLNNFLKDPSLTAVLS